MGVAASASPALANGGPIVLDAEEPRNLAKRIWQRVAEKPDGVVRSYREDGNHKTQSRVALWQRSADIAAALARAGAKPATAVVILSDDILDFLPAFWACIRGGFLAVPLMSAAKDASYRGQADFDAALSLLQGCFVLADDAFVALAKDRTQVLAGVIPLSSVAPDKTWIDRDLPSDPLCLTATSGSSGRLKLVALSHSALIYRNYDSTRQPAPSGSHALGTFPLDTVTGQHAIYLHTDAVTQLPARLMTARPTAILDAVEQLGISVLTMTSSMIGRILEQDGRASRPRNLSCLQSIGVGAEPIAARLIHDFAHLLKNHGGNSNLLGAGYGTTETGALTVGSRDFLTANPVSPICLGPPRSGVAIRIVAEDRSVVSLDELGELEVLCPEKIFSGYWGDPDLTRDSFTPDGWWKTGDLGQLIDGQLYLHGRAKEVFIQNGKKFSFADIDAEMQNDLRPGDVAHAFTASRPGEADRLAVVFAVSEHSPTDGIADAIRTALARRFGLYPSVVFATEIHRIPRTTAGKVRRSLLNGLDSARPAARSVEYPNGLQAGGTASSFREHLKAIWNRGHKFLTTPTFALLRPVGNRRTSPRFNTSPEFRWQLPPALRSSLMSALETWPGERPTKSRVMLANNTGGTRPPLFWVFNTNLEIKQFATALGDDQPLYAFLSGVEITDYHEDDVQALALAYLSDITEVCPHGPFFIAGNCQGGIIALAIAEHALRRKRHVPLLVLMDWSFPLQPFSGSVLLVSGSDNFNHNAIRHFQRPELAWKRAFASFEFAEIPGGYAQGFDEGQVEVLIEVLTSRMRSALSKPSKILPASGYHGRITVDDVPRIMEPGSRATINVVVRQDSDVAWAPTEQSGLVVGSRWLDANGHVLKNISCRAALPAMAPNSFVALDMKIMAPDNAGQFTLNVELCEEGNRWFGAPEAGFRAAVFVSPGHLSASGRG